MAARTAPHVNSSQLAPDTAEPDRRTILIAAVLSLIFIVLTRWPVARPQPFESDEFGFLERARSQWFPMHHTLFQTIARLLGGPLGDFYRGFIVLDMLTSALAVLSVWWFLRALVRPATAAAAAVLLAVSPVFWGYGAMAGNYTAIVAVGAFLLGVAYRGRSSPRLWHPLAVAVVLALGTGYRPDIGTLWLSVFGVILWQHGWRRALAALLLFTLANLAWMLPMLYVVAGGWARYRELSAEYAYECGYLNSIWHLGLIDAPVRYAVKLGMALVWTLGPALFLVPRGAARLVRMPRRRFLSMLMALAATPALGSHLFVQFGVAGWSFHYVPALLALAAIGADRSRALGWSASADDRRSKGTCRWLAGPRAGGEPPAGPGELSGHSLLVLPDRLQPDGLARQFRPIVLSIHPHRAQDAHSRPCTGILADRQFAPAGGHAGTPAPFSQGDRHEISCQSYACARSARRARRGITP